MTYAVEVMQDSGTASVSDVWDVNPLVVEVFNGDLLFELSRRTRKNVVLKIIETHSTPTTKQLYTQSPHTMYLIVTHFAELTILKILILC